jgi:hypothetical protein
MLVTPVPAAPALAHGGEAPAGTNYRAGITGVSPATPGVRVRVIEAGSRLELTSTSAREIEVLGYENEPYLRVSPAGVWENVNSAATYLNASISTSTAIPATAGPTVPPTWRQISDTPTVRWHDHRTYWMSDTPPPAVTADPDRPQRVRDWTVILRDGVSLITVTGTLDWQPPPYAGTWWAAVVLTGALVALLGLLRSRLTPWFLALASAAGGLSALAYTVGRELDAGNDTLGTALPALASTQLWPALTGLGGLAAAAFTLARRPSADFALALAGVCIGVFVGVSNAGALVNSVVPAPWPPTVARLLDLLALALGFGLTVAAVLRMRAAATAADGSPPPAPDAPPVRARRSPLTLKAALDEPADE